VKKGKQLQNKQMDLLRKMREAKEQNSPVRKESGESSSSNAILNDAEVKSINDRLRFEELLQSGTMPSLNDFGSDGYLNKEQEEEEIRAARTYMMQILISETQNDPLFDFELHCHDFLVDYTIFQCHNRCRD
jgi:hypothetical protein